MPRVSQALQGVMRAIDDGIAGARSQVDVDKLVAARQVLLSPQFTVIKGRRRAFVKTCPKCTFAKPTFLFNRNARKRDGLQTICRSCQAIVYQEHTGRAAEERS